MEEGEIEIATDRTFYPHSSRTTSTQLLHQDVVDTSGFVHSTSIEWPDDLCPASELSLTEESNTRSVSPGSPSASSSLRLVVQRSAILRRNQKLALLDGFSEIQLGRDTAPTGSETPRIRLKEMEVSKLHATIYWDYDRAQWSVVDMGSKHGTFVHSATFPTPAGSAARSTGEKGFRLSAPRVASMPHTLRHQDRLTIGGTTFTIHIHEDKKSCSACSPQVDEEIPLFLHRRTESDTALSTKRKRELSEEPSSMPPQERNPRKALTLLKRSLLSAKLSTHASSERPSKLYVDRSARRRALHPDHSPMPTLKTGNTNRSVIPPPSQILGTQPPSVPPIPPAPLSSTNIGHKLLVKQGWQPGTALGEPSSDTVGLVVPLDPPSTVGRAGIGVPVRTSSNPNVPEDGDWKGVGQGRRWEEVRASDNIR